MKQKQCPSMYPTRDGAVFCTNEKGAGHEDDHIGYRKRWRRCDSCNGGGKTVGKRCITCKGVGSILVKKEKVKGVPTPVAAPVEKGAEP